jgi:hypothetical protein
MYKGLPDLRRQFIHHVEKFCTNYRFFSVAEFKLHEESENRGYSFNKSKIGAARKPISISVTNGQMNYEWQHLMAKLKQRSPAVYEKWYKCKTIEPHPLFTVYAGEIEEWEKQ